MLKHVRKAAFGILRHTPRMRQLSRSIYYSLRGKQYLKLANRTQTEKKTVLFESFGGKQYSCSPRAIYEYMLSDPRYDDYEFIWAFTGSALERFSEMPQLTRATFVKRGDDAYFQACARAKYWVFNSRLAEYIYPKDDQVFVQCWHGTPLKRLGYDIAIETQAALNTSEELADRYGIDCSKWTYALSPSPYTSEKLASAFGLPKERIPEVIIEEGYPRNDRIVRVCSDPAELKAARAALNERFGVPEDKKVLLYAPTWRDDSYCAGVGYVLSDILIDFDQMREALSDEWVILFRAHYFIADQVDISAYEGFVFDVSKDADINDLYIVADVLMTDYSSVFFDYANTKRPMIFFWPDYEHYANDIRGFYFPLSELPGAHCQTTDEVIAAMNALDTCDALHDEEYVRFRSKFSPKDDGYSAKRVAERVFE